MSAPSAPTPPAPASAARKKPLSICATPTNYEVGLFRPPHRSRRHRNGRIVRRRAPSGSLPRTLARQHGLRDQGGRQEYPLVSVSQPRGFPLRLPPLRPAFPRSLGQPHRWRFLLGERPPILAESRPRQLAPRPAAASHPRPAPPFARLDAGLGGCQRRFGRRHQPPG